MQAEFCTFVGLAKSNYGLLYRYRCQKRLVAKRGSYVTNRQHSQLSELAGLAIRTNRFCFALRGCRGFE